MIWNLFESWVCIRNNIWYVKLRIYYLCILLYKLYFIKFNKIHDHANALNRDEFLVVTMNFFACEFWDFFYFLCWFIVNFLCFMLYFFLVLLLSYVFEFCSIFFWNFSYFVRNILAMNFGFFEKICLYKNSILEMSYDLSDWLFEVRFTFYRFILSRDRFICCSR